MLRMFALIAALYAFVKVRRSGITLSNAEILLRLSAAQLLNLAQRGLESVQTAIEL